MSEIGDRLRSLFEEIAPRPSVEGLIAGERSVAPRLRPRLLVAVALFSAVAVTTGVLLLLGPGSDRTPDAATTLPEALSTSSLPATTITVPGSIDDDFHALVPESIECLVGGVDIPCAEINDQNPFTAWTVPWDDDLPIVTMSFGETVTVSGVALQNLGDRLEFLRRSRIRQIELTTDEGGSVLVDFEDSNLDGNGVSVPPLTGSVFTIHVLAVYSPQGGYGTQDFPALPEIAVAELQLGGRIAAESETGSEVTGWAGEWSHVNVDPARRGRARDLAFNGESFALMTRMTGGDFVVWESDDGLVWVEAAEWAAEWDSDLHVGPLSFSSRGGGWVVAGSAGGRATVWRSWMGWDSVTVDGGPDSSWSAIGSIVEWQGRLVAAGGGTFGTMPPEDVVAAAWYSDDAGASWQRSDVPDAQMLRFDSLVAGPAGILGLASDHSTFWWPVLYRSFDGISWERITPIGLETSFVVQVFGDSLGYLLHDPNFGKVWSSVDAVHWVATDLPSRTPDGGDAVGFTTVARYQGAVVLTGIGVFEDRADSNARSPIAISQVDGGWVVASLDVPAGVDHLVAGNDRLVMAGAVRTTPPEVPEEGATLYVTAFVFRPDDQPEALPCTDRSPPLTDQDLPAAVAETRRAIHQAAIDCDWVALSRLASQGDFLHTVGGQGGVGDPTEYWIERMRQGDDILGNIATVLTLPPRQVTSGDGETEWVWPAVAYKDNPTDADWQALLPLYDQQRIDEMRDRDSYEGGFLLQIGGDGLWTLAGRMLD